MWGGNSSGEAVGWSAFRIGPSSFTPRCREVRDTFSRFWAMQGALGRASPGVLAGWGMRGEARNSAVRLETDCPWATIAAA
mgnify:CR=1 FL=1